jgi:thermostable 8-oxoguanine DNA glycosylase
MSHFAEITSRVNRRDISWIPALSFLRFNPAHPPTTATTAYRGIAMQRMYALMDGEVRQLELPPPEACIVPGVQWGMFDELLTPAYWKGQAWQHIATGGYGDLRLGRSLVEELAACLLGGYGMPAELGLAAFGRLLKFGLITSGVSAREIEAALSRPFAIRGRERRYRFPRQKAKYLSHCLAMMEDFREPNSDVSLRDTLARLPGIGLKTASWIVRNYRASDNVAVIDIHILRAGRHIGLFADHWQPGRHYRRLESAFLEFARALQVSACVLDGLIWDYMRQITGAMRTANRKPSYTSGLLPLATPA